MQKPPFSPVLLIFNAERALDSVNLNFMYLVFRQFGFSNVNCASKQSIRTPQLGKIRLTTDNFEGCCLSILLFALHNKQLKQAHWQSEGIKTD